MVQEHVRSWGVNDVYVGCSGAFTIERFLGPLGHRMHGNDVSIYTCQLGKYLSGQFVDYTIRPESAEELAWLEPYMETDADRIATLMLGTRFLQFVGKSGAYFDRMLDGFQRQFPEMHAETKAKVEAVSVKLESFHVMDVRDWLRNVVPPEGAVASFPPFDCLAPEHRLLTADLRWVPCGELQAGDEIMAFEEYPTDGRRSRRWQRARITRSEPGVKECVRVTLANGDEIVCTTDHPWLARTSAGQPQQWVTADELMTQKPNGKKRRIAPVQVFRPIRVWETDESRDAGWCAGMLDGEGSLNIRHSAAKGGSFAVDMAQAEGPLLDQYVKRMMEMGFNLSLDPRKTVNRPGGMGHFTKNVWSARSTGSVPDQMELLGRLRPERLLAKFADSPICDFAFRAAGDRYVDVVSVEFIGPQTIQSISTSTQTYIGEGYAMHNTGGYETMWKPLDQHFEWAEPDYDILDEKGIHDTLELIMDRDHWILASNHRRPEWEERLVGVVQTSPRRRPNYVYASTEKTRIVKPRTVLEPVKVPRLGKGDRIGETLKLAPLTLPQFNMLRAQYLNPKIRTAAPSASFAVLSEGRIIGAIAVLPGKFDPDEIYLMSDFAVASSDYPKLSKLVVMAACSKELQHLMQNAMSRPIRKVATTAFTQKPVSMKYRSILSLSKRSDSADPDFAFELQYGGEVGRWTLTEAVAIWKEKWGQLKDA